MKSQNWSFEELCRAYRSVASLINDVRCTKQMIASCLDRRLDVYAVIHRNGDQCLLQRQTWPESDETRVTHTVGDIKAGLLL